MINCRQITRKYYGNIRFALAVAVCVSAFAGCNAFMPVGVSSSAAPRGISLDTFPEHFVYRIDEHRYLTIQGNDDCAGRIYFNDNQAGIRTLVATTGIAVGSGKYRGYYAAQSPYIAIPSIGYSQISGPLLYINYSHDGGRTFKRFLAGGDFADENVVILDGQNLYIGLDRSDAAKGITQTILMNISRDIATGDDQRAIRSERPSIEPSRVPIKLSSPSGQNKWKCSELPRD